MRARDHQQTDSAVDLGRRHFVVAGASVAGGLVVGLPQLGWAETDDDANPRMIGYFIEINTDNSVIIGSNQPEIGQGLRTALPMLVAEEADLDWDQVTVRQMPLGLVRTEEGFTWKYGGQGVGGSTGLRSNYEYMRGVGATARGQLLAAAANAWDVPVGDCRTERGRVICDRLDRSASYGELVTAAAALPLPEEPPALKDPAEFRIAGTRRQTIDVRDIVTGKASYGIDSRVPGMRYAMIERCPHLDGTVASFDASEALKVPGVLKVFEVKGPEPGAPYQILAHGVAVVADSTWAAIQGRRALKVQWNPGPHTSESTASFMADNRQMLKGRGQVVRDDGDFDAAIASAAKVVTRQYEIPFVNHAPLEPQNCIVHVQPDQALVIAPTQIPSGASREVASVTGLERDRITVEMTRVGGGFGRRLSNDYVAEAAILSKETGWPIKLVWTREDDIRHDFFRPSGVHEMSAGLDQDGKPVAWTQRLASASKHWRRPDTPDENLWMPELYQDDFPAQRIPNFRLEYFHHASGMPRGSWRAPAHTANAFVVQSFIDELAHESGQDFLDLQLAMLGETEDLPYSNHGGPVFNPGRLAKLLRFVADEIDYRSERPKGRGVGLATHYTFGGYAAHAIEVAVSDEGELSIERVVAAIDCGFAVHPNAVEAQLQGGTIDGLSTALNLEITVKDGQVVQSNFHDYPIMRMDQMPKRFEAHVLDWGGEVKGVGEMGIPPAAPALTNAIFAATGVRIRKLPIGNQLREAMRS